MTKMSTIYNRLSYGTGVTLAGGGVSAKAYAAKTAADSAWLIEKIAGVTRTVYVPAQCTPLPASLTQPVLVPLPPPAD
ncbi:hypothetical protein F9U42_14345 [Pectobacterium versatile]|uniref:hypothetical protein n=1 Tax=Pectobacterium versatile TaxID=2488639 RepID=UPI001B383E0A|nr:hypothetical protein [Pectobacterium versatile]MBQ4768319.1 hypothetical protein [Pectobacterium versatile]